jgi:hypothetical protein
LGDTSIPTPILPPHTIRFPPYKSLWVSLHFSTKGNEEKEKEREKRSWLMCATVGNEFSRRDRVWFFRSSLRVLKSFSPFAIRNDSPIKSVPFTMKKV